MGAGGRESSAKVSTHKMSLKETFVRPHVWQPRGGHSICVFM